MKRFEVSYSRIIDLINESKEIYVMATLFFDITGYVPVSKEDVLNIMDSNSGVEFFSYQVTWDQEKKILRIN